MATITSSFPHLFSNVCKHIRYLNHLLAKQTQSQFFMETIESGLIYIYKNMEILNLLNAPLRNSQIRRYKRSNFLGAQFFLKDVLDEETFPPNAITLNVQIDASDKAKVLDIVVKYFQSFLSEDIITEKQADGSLLVHFQTFEAIQIYTEGLGQLIKTLLDTHTIKGI